MTNNWKCTALTGHNINYLMTASKYTNRMVYKTQDSGMEELSDELMYSSKQKK